MEMIERWVTGLFCIGIISSLLVAERVTSVSGFISTNTALVKGTRAQFARAVLESRRRRERVHDRRRVIAEPVETSANLSRAVHQDDGR